MTELPLISVITVVKNGEDCLEATIQSVLNQTYKPVAYIIIDGGSTDGTLSIIQKHEHRIAYWESKPDKGIYDAMNKAVLKASGDWIHFMNAGDAFFEDAVLETIFKNPIPTETGVLYGDTEIVSRSKKPYLSKAKKLEFFSKNMPFCHQAAFVRQHYMARGFDTQYTLAADYDFFYRLYREKAGFQYLPLVVAKYNAQGISSVNAVDCFYEYQLISEKTRFLKLRLALLKIKLKIRSFLPKRALALISMIKEANPFKLTL